MNSYNMEFNADFGQFQKVTERGLDGLSAYEVAVKNGFNGTEQEWLESLHGGITDPELSETSENPVMNKAVTKEINLLKESIADSEISDEKVQTAVENYLEENPVEASVPDLVGYTGILFYDNGNTKAYNPLVNTAVDNFKSAKVSALLQKYAKTAEVYSTPDVLAHESAFSGNGNGLYSWVENVAGTTADVPSDTGITAVKARRINGGKWASNGVPLKSNNEIITVAQKGDEALNTLTGETFNIQGGVGYQTYDCDGVNILCGYVPSWNKLRGMTIPCRYGTKPDGSGWGVIIGTRQTWTLTIDGDLGDYDYSRLPSPLNGATLHPSNQVAKIGTTYYRADAVPNNGFVLVSSTDLINWTFVSHVTLPDGFDDNTATEVCCGEKSGRLYVALRQITDSGTLYVGKMNADFKSLNSLVGLPDCGSKPFFFKPYGEEHLLIMTAPVDRYSCRVYDILSRYTMTKIVPLFELYGVACNYPVIGAHGRGDGYISFAGTNGAQTDLKGVSVLPVLLNIGTLIKRQPESTDPILMDKDKNVITFGDLYDVSGSGSGGSYELPVATADKLGGVMPVAKTDSMTQSVGVDENGGLWTAPSSGGSSSGGEAWELINTLTITEGNASEVVNLTKAYKKLAVYCLGVKLSATGKLCAYPDTASGYSAIKLMDINVPTNGLYGGAIIEKITSKMAYYKQSDNTLAFQNPQTGKWVTSNLYFVPATSGTTFSSGTIYVYGIPE